MCKQVINNETLDRWREQAERVRHEISFFECSIEDDFDRHVYNSRPSNFIALIDSLENARRRIVYLSDALNESSEKSEIKLRQDLEYEKGISQIHYEEKIEVLWKLNIAVKALEEYAARDYRYYDVKDIEHSTSDIAKEALAKIRGQG